MSTDVETKINMAIGEASSCWSNLAGAGVFDSTRAAAIAERLLADVRAYLVGEAPVTAELSLELIDSPHLLEALLDQANMAGETPTFAAIDANAVPFLASLREVGGDNTVLVYIGTDEDGGPGGRTNCDECGDQTSNWVPRFPVRLVVGAVSR